VDLSVDLSVDLARRVGLKALLAVGKNSMFVGKAEDACDL
jgi:hypothetical protein